jgi:SpoVK/Ycf46/Vps4 family AAA+-type ATPase
MCVHVYECVCGLNPCVTFSLSRTHTGSSEKQLAKLFATARRSAPSVILLDEIDCLAASRVQTNASGSSGIYMCV